MKNDREEILRKRQMAFIGKKLACYPNSIGNSLAAIRESASFLGDLLGHSGRWSDEDREEFTKILSTIENQVNILSRKSNYLDRFAHRMDGTVTDLKPSEIVEEVVSFASRFARLRQVSLKLESAEILPELYSDPLRIYFLVSIMIDDMLARSKKGGNVAVKVKQTDNGVLIEVQGYGALDAAAPSPEGRDQYWPAGLQAVYDLGGRLETSTTGSDIRQTSLFLPVKQASKPADPD